MSRISVRNRALRLLGRQLGAPTGPIGHVVGSMLNRGNAASVSAAVQCLDLRGGETVADIGFGGGLGLDLLLNATSDSRVAGVEPSTTMLRRAGKRRSAAVASGRLELHQATMATLPFADGGLDGWITVNTIYFVGDFPTAAGELRRVLAQNGRGVVGIADPEWMRHQPFATHGFTLRPVAEVIDVLESAGLSVEHRTIGDGQPPFHLLVTTPSP